MGGAHTALELVTFLGASLVLMTPGVLAAMWLGWGESTFERIANGVVLGLAAAVYLATAMSYFDLRLFYPAWACVGVGAVAVTIFGYAKSIRDADPAKLEVNQTPESEVLRRPGPTAQKARHFGVSQNRRPVRERNPTWGIHGNGFRVEERCLLIVLLLVAITRFYPVLGRRFPAGWDPTFHLILVRTIQLAQHMIFDWRPFDAVALNYPLGSHMLLVVLSAMSRVPAHQVFNLLQPTLGVLTTAQVFYLSRRLAKGNASVALFSALAYGLWEYYGSIAYYTWGGLPNQLAMLFFIPALKLIFDRRARLLDENGVGSTSRTAASTAGDHVATILFGLLYAAVALTHHHVMLTSGVLLAVLCIASLFHQDKEQGYRFILAGFAVAGILASFYLLPYAWKVTTIRSTNVWRLGEDPIPLRRLPWRFGYAFCVATAVGIVISWKRWGGDWTRRRSQTGMPGPPEGQARQECPAHRVSAVPPLNPSIVWICLTLAALYVGCDYGARYVTGRIYGAELASTAFTPTRFLEDMSYFLCVFAGIAMNELRRRIGLPATMAVGIGLLFTVTPGWYPLCIPLEPPTGFQRGCAWIQAHTSPDSIVVPAPEIEANQACWCTYLAWRRTAPATPMPVSEPIGEIEPRMARVRDIQLGVSPPDSADMQIVQLVPPGVGNPFRVVWESQDGWRVTKVFPK